MQKVELIATATFGLESVVAEEVKALGYGPVQVENGKVTFTADISAIPRTNLWLRTADRVRLKIGEFKATTFDELFEKTKALPWADWITEDGTFPVEGKSVKSTLFSVPDCQAIVKKAVVESLKKTYKREWFDEQGPLYKIEVALLKDVATLTIDTSGPGLHKRGYRELIGQAPLKETMAAAMIMLSRWKPDRVFMDPFCGSGTIPIEAALIGQNIAPGMNREFVSETWPIIPKTAWREARAETHDLARYDQKLEIIGTDMDDEILKIARRNATEAGVDDLIHFQRMDVRDVRTKRKYGYLICNPPYGERLGEWKQVAKMYGEMGKTFAAMDTWSFYIITSDEQFEEHFGRTASKKRKLYNGNIKVDYYQFFGPRPPRGPMVTPTE
ncbi:class I SAM-dependent RNA methyltransferase [Brevibacillus sp. M2.1A]|uniref:THUMP domain-containing class I SAM-dependent RNA methyltransferase n=1 Tax=Brevibacillus TaxID=55080 RepID=UPI00156A95B8|nr:MULTISPECIES: class I SAM-dependent RNA methyltransferase [Brevibacillus]MBY0084972.1 class I SAM-dependent RNA methyltransferase [Brevibacillus brevis]MCC8433115.1 class I SAM-dependent RNA methyltransferase [Brevibacillus sp. M2.1A]MCE0451185.1 class I SAM-dependent RNA methyltransferase [Brevibacillus sp. AF8]MCM3143577.1 class I SAM-dependent RNA methyltransferase [Brevibacillus sp. MER 51]UKL00843.1 class I SAM-dependent RNA methyltransferase [Brevibacillus brevis]